MSEHPKSNVLPGRTRLADSKTWSPSSSKMVTIALMVVIALLAEWPVVYAAGKTAGTTQQHPPDPEELFMAWINKIGVQHRLKIQTPPGGERGLYAAGDISQHGVIARIPMQHAIWFDRSLKTVMDMGELLAREALNAASPFAPWLAALPMLHDPAHTVTMHTLPREYLPLVGSKVLEDHITAVQDNIASFWEKNRGRLTKDGITLDRLKAAIGTVSSRVKDWEYKGIKRHIIVPLLDFANHDTNCINYWQFGRCDFFEKPEYSDNNGDMRYYGNASNVAVKDLCVFWRAGTDIKAGDQACHQYGPLTPDTAFYEYGYEMTPSFVFPSCMDWPGYSVDHIVGPLVHSMPNIIDGPLSALETELDRVLNRIKELEALADKEAAMKVAPSDPSGSVLRGMKALRQQRLIGLRGEAERLRKRILEVKPSGSGQRDEL